MVRKLRERATHFDDPAGSEHLDIRHEDLLEPSLAARRLDDAAREVLLDCVRSNQRLALDEGKLRRLSANGADSAMALIVDEDVQRMLSARSKRC